MLIVTVVVIVVLDIVDEYCWDVWANSTRETLRYKDKIALKICLGKTSKILFH